MSKHDLLRSIHLMKTRLILEVFFSYLLLIPGNSGHRLQLQEAVELKSGHGTNNSGMTEQAFGRIPDWPTVHKRSDKQYELLPRGVLLVMCGEFCNKVKAT